MSGSLLAELAEICGPGAARFARPVDQIAGQPASFVASPATAGSVSRLLELAGNAA